MQFGGGFWQSSYVSPSQILRELLAKETTDIYVVLDEENAIQELKNQNNELIEL